MEYIVRKCKNNTIGEGGRLRFVAQCVTIGAGRFWRKGQAMILVTGGAGFIGSHLVRSLVDAGESVRVFDNLSSGHAHHLDPLREHIDVQIGDVRDADAVAAAVEGVDLVIHLAALISVVQSVAEPRLTHEINVTGALNVFEAARGARVRRVVLASSAAVYGDPAQVPTPEDAPKAPLSPYGLSKLMGEQYGQLYSAQYGLECVSLRFFNVYGPRQDPKSPYAAAVPIFLDRMLTGEQPLIYGDGTQSRDFVYVGDIVRALWTAGTAPGLGGDVFNVARGEPTTVNDLVERLGEALGVDIAPRYAPPRPGEIRHSCADVAHFADRAGFRAATDLQTGLNELVRSV